MSEYRVFDLSDWIQVGQGGNGTTYENPSQPDLILNVDKKQINTLEFVRAHRRDGAAYVPRTKLQG